MSDDRGRWFRVYARMVKQHLKFRDLTGNELGAWLALRSECELRDGAMLDDTDEAVRILRKRKIPRPAAVLDRLVSLRLFDVTDEGVAVHDRTDHDRADTPSEQQKHRREHRRVEPTEDCDYCLIERWDRSVGRYGSWVSRGVDVDYPHSTQRGLPQQAAPAPSTQPADTDATTASLPSDDDSATAACRKFLNGGTWLSNLEYVAGWDDLDRRFTREWVQAEIDPAYAELHAANPKVKPWDLKHRVEFRCAERVRLEDKRRERAEAEQRRKESDALKVKAAAASEEDKRRAEITRRAVSLWLKHKPNEPVPTEFEELEAWLERNGEAA